MCNCHLHLYCNPDYLNALTRFETLCKCLRYVKLTVKKLFTHIQPFVHFFFLNVWVEILGRFCQNLDVKKPSDFRNANVFSQILDVIHVDICLLRALRNISVKLFQNLTSSLRAEDFLKISSCLLESKYFPFTRAKFIDIPKFRKQLLKMVTQGTFL